MTKPFVVSETELVEKIKIFLDECDSDELARIAGEIFGGQCFWDGFDENVFDREEYYSFEPDENYWGAFDTGYEEEQEYFYRLHTNLWQSDEDIELSDIMDDAEYDFYSNLAEITALEQSYEVLDSK